MSNEKACRLFGAKGFLASLVLLLLLCICPTAEAVVEWPVPAYAQRYSFRIPVEVNPNNTEIWTTNESGIPQDCGIACLSMLEAYHTMDYSGRDFIYYRMFAAVNPYAAWSTTGTDMELSSDPTFISGSAYAVHSSFTPEDILAKLNAGIPVMVYKGGIHWVVIYGYDGPSSYVNWGSFKIMNPTYDYGVIYQYLSDFIGNFGQLTRMMYRTGGILPNRSVAFGKNELHVKFHMNDGALSVAVSPDGNIELAANADVAEQEWKLVECFNSTYTLTNVKTGYVMDLRNGGTVNGTNIEQGVPWKNYEPSQVYQRWYLHNNGPYYRLTPEAMLSRSLNVAGGQVTAGANLELYDINDTACQQLTFERLDDTMLAGIACSESSLTLKGGESKQLSVSFQPAQGLPDYRRRVTWRSSDTNVAEVDANGLVTARGAGECIIWVQSAYHDAFSAQCAVTVETSMEMPVIRAVDVDGYTVQLSWNEVQPENAGDVIAYEAAVYRTDGTEECVWAQQAIKTTACGFTLSQNGEYEVRLRAVSQTNGASSDFNARTFIIVDDEWLYVDEIPETIPGDSSHVEIQYLSSYNAREQLESPGEGWVCSERRVSYVDGNVLYSEELYPLAESETLVGLGTYYYHYCDGYSAVEHYWTDRFQYLTRIDNVGQFDIVWQGTDDADPRFSVYRLKWNSGEWAGGLATCAHGTADAMALYYLGYRYQERTEVVTCVWTREADWSYERDPDADAVSYRIRSIAYENQLRIPEGVVRIEAEAFMNDEVIEEVIIPEGCGYIGSKAFAGCTDLKRVLIPDGIAVETDAFEGSPQVYLIRISR